jgi:hypothetical protein
MAMIAAADPDEISDDRSAARGGGRSSASST